MCAGLPFVLSKYFYEILLMRNYYLNANIQKVLVFSETTVIVVSGKTNMHV